MSMAKALGLTDEQFLSLIENNCHLVSCRYNKNSKCIDEDKRKECVEVSKAVLCLEDSETNEFSEIEKEI